MARIGPNFPNELAAAGLLGLPFSWDADGNVHCAAEMTRAQRAKLDAVIAAHDASRPWQPPDRSASKSRAPD